MKNLPDNELLALWKQEKKVIPIQRDMKFLKELQNELEKRGFKLTS